jgi:hypothetical protein
MFDAIDGQRTIAEIAIRAGLESAADCAKSFFEKLWRYDQVVFDTVGGATSALSPVIGRESLRSSTR